MEKNVKMTSLSDDILEIFNDWQVKLINVKFLNVNEINDTINGRINSEVAGKQLIALCLHFVRFFDLLKRETPKKLKFWVKYSNLSFALL